MPLPPCPNHLSIAAGKRCGRCGRLFCERCVVEMWGQELCQGCKTALVQEVQHRKAMDPARVVFWARVFDWVLAAPALFWGIVWVVTLLWPDPRNEYTEIYLVGAVLGLVFPLPPALGLGPRRGWAYRYQFATLTVGALLSVCSLSVAGVVLWIPAALLLTHWVRPEVRGYCDQGR